MIIATYIYRMIRNHIVFLHEVDEFLGIKSIEPNSNRCLTVLRHTKQSIHKKTGFSYIGFEQFLCEF